MQQFLAKIKAKAAENPKRIVLPEALLDERVMQAAQLIVKEKTAIVCLLGEQADLEKRCKDFDLKESEFLELWDFADKDELVAEYYKLRQHKGITESEVESLLTDINYYGTMLVKTGKVDGMISGTTFPTADTIRPALQVLTTKDEFRKVSGFFFLILEERVFLFADCAINIDPSAEDLAGIALDTARTALQFDMIPKVAMLSFSTHHSADHPLVDKVRTATRIVKEQLPQALVDGEIQVDTAMVPEVAARKAPSSPIQGDANILIFPNLEAGNIGYKLVERLAKAKAIGPVLQGLDRPINDLSRGCNVLDIVNLAAVTTVQAQAISKK